MAACLRTQSSIYCIVLVSALSCLAARDSTGMVELSRIVVRATGKSLMAYNCLDSNAISRLRESRSVDGMLANLAGIDVQRSSPAAGKGRGVTIRGFDESRYLILLDGRPLNGSGVMGGHYVDWSSLSTDNIKKIEIIRGAKSAEYGNSLGGTVNIITRGGKDLPGKTTVQASYGVLSAEDPDDTYEKRKSAVSITHRASIGKAASVDLYAAHAAGEPFLRNNYYRTINLGGTASFYLPLDIVLGAGVRNSIQYRGFAIYNHPHDPYYDPRYPQSEASAGGGPGIKWNTRVADSLNFGDRSYWSNIRRQIDLFLKKEFAPLTLSARVYTNDQNRTEYYYAIDDTNKLVLERFTEPEDHTWGWSIKADQRLGEKHRLKYGVEGSILRYGGIDIRHKDSAYFRFQPEDGGHETIRAALRHSAFLQSSLSFLERVELSPGVRYDYYLGTRRDSTVDETPLHGVSPNGGMRIELWPGGAVALHGAYTNRFPTCPELYWYYNGHTFDGRKDLSPERAIQTELGISQRIANDNAFESELRLRGYHYIVSDYIRTIFGGRVPPSSPLKQRASRLIYNIDRATFTGVELEAEARVLDALKLWGNYTYQITRKSGDDFDSSMAYSNRLPELPEHKANGGVEYTWTNGAVAGLAMRFVDKREVIGSSFSAGGASYQTIDPFITFGLTGSYPVYTSDVFAAKLKLRVDNLLDADYVEEPGIPMPGITPAAAVELSF